MLMQVIVALKLFPVPWETARKVDKCISWPKRFVNSSEAITNVLNIQRGVEMDLWVVLELTNKPPPVQLSRHS